MPRLGLGRNLSIPRRAGGTLLGGAHLFNGTSTRVQLTNVMSLQDFTIMFWMKSNFSTSGMIIDFRDASNDGVRMQNNSSTTTFCQYNTAVVGHTIVNQVWAHIALTANTTTELLTPVLNGVAGTTASIAGTDIATTTAGRIGCLSTAANTFYKGQLAQMAIFNTALSAATISGLMNKTYSQLSAGDKTNLVSWWALTNISGTSVPDLHGSNHGTLTP